MEMINLSVPATNRFASNYLEQTADIQSFFHYRYDTTEAYEERLDELKNRSFPRMEMAAHIQDYMSKFPSSSEIDRSINKLRQPNSTVVIGGQQAGIFTGPLYTIHKVISIIALAEQKEKDLGVPVVPVFWIAGEDHDYPEVNHVYVPKENKAEKWSYPESVLHKKMITDLKLDQIRCKAWANEILKSFGETENTGEVLAFLEQAIDQSETFVDFFACIIMELFKDKGLLIVDSGNPGMRTLEKSIFNNLIHSHQKITDSLLNQQKNVLEDNYSITIESKSNAANLFYYDQVRNERILLDYDMENERFVGKSGAVVFTKDQLVELAEHHPEKLSNNVVTRPLTQEWLFPTLAFIAGPGEISYWAELKEVFELFDMKMPPIVPRLNITFLDRSTETDLKELSIKLEDVLTNGTEIHRENFVHSVKDKELEKLFVEARAAFLAQYQLIEAKLRENDRGIVPLFKKNEELILKQMQFMIDRVDLSQREKHRVEIDKYERINTALRPNGIPQERVWNIFQYLNAYGIDFVARVFQLNFVFDGTHKVIKI